jgi:CheY-like chemotaxis protein
MDISLKGSISGIDVSKQISHLNIPIVYLTGSSNDENIKNALETAPYGFISKPIFDLELEQILELTLIKHTDDFEKIFGTEISQTPDSQSTNKSKKEPKFKSLIRGILKK